MGPRVMLLVGLLALAACGQPVEELADTEDRSWPAQVRYEHHLHDGEVLLAEAEQEFAGESWNDWTDITVTGRDHDGTPLDGRITRFVDGWFRSGYLRASLEPQQPFLDSRHRREFPNNATIYVDSREPAADNQTPTDYGTLPISSEAESGADGDGTVAPNDIFNRAFGAHWTSESGFSPAGDDALPQDRHDGIAADVNDTAERLGLDPAELSRAVYEVDDCVGERCEVWASIFHTAAQVPLEVRWYLPDGTVRTLVASAARFGDLQP